MKHQVERNSPCPCGSGKKFKKCHLLTGGFYPEMDEDFKLGQRLIQEFEAEQKSYSPFEDTPEYHESFV